MRHGVRADIVSGVVALLLFGGSAVARAAVPCEVPQPAAAGDAWKPPLDRLVSFEAKETSLRDALTRLATAGRVRLSFAADLLPLTQRVCIGFSRAPLGDALQALLRGTSLQPVAVGGDQVALAPTARVVSGLAASFTPRDTLTHLSPVIVSGSAADATTRSSPITPDIIVGGSLPLRSTTSFSDALNGSVPGLWMWEQSPSSVAARYGSIRGASSLGASAPKVYIDGVEVANANLVHDLQPETIDRIEVIRGPQGSVLYGADAIGGVINIVTRHDGVPVDGRHLRGRSQMGLTTGDYSPLGVLVSDHSLALRAGAPSRAAGLAASLSTLGAYVPGATNEQFSVQGDLQLVKQRTSLTALARLFGENAGTPVSPLLPTAVVDAAFPFDPVAREENVRRGGLAEAWTLSGEQRIRQYTLGVTGMFAATGRLTHSLVAGVDGYRLSTSALPGPLRLAADSAALSAPAWADRGTLRLKSVAVLGAPDREVKLTIGAEGSVLREAAGLGATGEAPDLARPIWRSSGGLFAQTEAQLPSDVSVNAGLRGERVVGYAGGDEFMMLPMLGVAWTREARSWTLRLHSAYGRGFRPPRAQLWTDPWSSGHQRLVANADLEPEVQSGIEVGASVWYRDALSLRLTRFDQRASGLIQAVPDASTVGRRAPQVSELSLQNVGLVANRGWEAQGSLLLGSLNLTATLSTVDSRVQRLTARYTGDLRAGDRMLGVPSRTASVSGTWTRPSWSASFALVRASDWVNYDYLTLAQAAMLSAPNSAAVSLRDYWLGYSGATRLRAAVSHELYRGMSLLLTGENLLGRQTGEPDNLTVVPGRRISLGLRF